MVHFYSSRHVRPPAPEPKSRGGAGGSAVPLPNTGVAAQGVTIPGHGGAGKPLPAIEHSVERTERQREQ